jgi:hypothetical protein
MYAAALKPGSTETWKWILSQPGVNVNYRYRGRSILEAAIGSRVTDLAAIVDALIKHGWYSSC